MLRDKLLSFERIDDVELPGLSQRRHPVLVGGLAILAACFESLNLKSMKVSPFALREGVLHDLMFQLPEYGEPGRSFVITGEMIRQGSANVLLEGGDRRRETA